MTGSTRGLFRAASLRPILALLMVMMVVPMVSGQEDAGADTTDHGGSIFAPFVSRLRISTRDPEIRLTWKDSEDVDGACRIYRHTSEINAETFLDAELVAQVESGVQSFIDAPAHPGDYYYGVFAESAAGSLYEIFIPYRNTTFAPVTVANVATLAERSAHIRGIQAVENDGVILVEYESDQVGRELIVYRSTSPFTAPDDLLSAGIVATVMSTVESVIDYPVPGVPYYYGVVDSALVAEGSAVFEPGGNATETSVEIPLPTAAAALQPEPEPETTSEPVEQQPDETSASPQVASVPQGTPEPVEVVEQPEEPAEAEPAQQVFVPEISRRRPLPLPFLQLNTDLQTGDRLGDAVITVADPQSISSTTQAALDEMLGRLTPRSPESLRPEILPEDTLPSPHGAEFTLRTILDGPIANLAWEDALLQLNNFLSLPLSSDVRSRALFYRAQCFYFTGETARAFVEFLLARDAHFAEAEGWLDVILGSSAGA
ncbi:MAG: hypothetical protein KOO61_05195 [Spirochaetales bacterium]|nr:hypothetical protein [Spirochaetales bacterium]